MRHLAGRVGAILLSVFCATPLFAADDAIGCTRCSTVASAIAKALHEQDRGRSGLRAGEGNWLMSYRLQVSQRFALQSDVQFALDPAVDAAVDSRWAIGLRFVIGTR
jgi:hypothetical protein